MVQLRARILVVNAATTQSTTSTAADHATLWPKKA
jgi:hypothetical protein